MIFIFIISLILLLQLFTIKKFFKLHFLLLLLWNQLIILLLVGAKELKINIQESIFLILFIIGFMVFQRMQLEIKKNIKEVDREI